ncbi:molybdopterin-dependent oxidoreductase [Streptomyces sp. 3MP-14]|uniref:Molybdopterin-dependent oxidoreductase n=1 Tax=Streptomyces mimosae TaxID=2586635 RepID=A0A5N6ALX2_9ACTN|nr:MULTISPECIES: molybdopterin-dependent oxidoreductase [Streptomyces]KAB8168910.1 molybdopterin-dependent oxidoreductase [Streptomyces mimosae]KAB8178234.1 molybdopterin-dependent oxidoreductase [Streptomyces sp. 3MP-14]
MPAPPLPRFSERLHDARTATAVGRWLGLGVLVCFLTGLVSHGVQTPPGWLAPLLPTRPVWGYRVTQGLHVACGIALVPLLLVKLWVVYPRLFVWPPVRSVANALDRLSIAVLVSAALLEVLLGLTNITQWYPWPFPFKPVHWALAWVLAGSLLLHVGVRLGLVVAGWRRVAGDPVEADRRSLLRGMGAGVAAVTLTTVGQTATPLRPLNLLAPRDPEPGTAGTTQGLPINRSAAAAGVDAAELTSPDWRLTVVGEREERLSLGALRALPQHTERLPIACVEGWSASAEWTGVRLSDLLRRVGAAEGASVRVVSAQRSGGYRVMEMPAGYVRDPLTLLALRVNGEVLSLDHGFPARIIAPNRPGVWQTKWVARIEVLR